MKDKNELEIISLRQKEASVLILPRVHRTEDLLLVVNEGLGTGEVYR